jgi:hypothetical protein
MESPSANLRALQLETEEQGTKELAAAMDAFLGGFSWARRTGNAWVGLCIPAVLGLFLVELDPPSDDIDRSTWVIVGDLPPAYISPEFASSPREALEAYIAEMSAWVEAVEKGEPVDDLIPVNGAATPANAAALKSRLSFIENKILPDCE